MSLEPSFFSAAGITGSKGSLQRTRSDTSSHLHKTRDSEAPVSENRSKVSNKSKNSRKLDSRKSDKSASLFLRRQFALCHQVGDGMS